MGNRDNQSSGRNTNFADVLLAIVNGIFNLLKISKIICILVLYLIWRDYRIISTLPEGADVSEYLIDTKIINRIFDNDNIAIIVMGVVIGALLVIIGILIFAVIPMHKKEISRLSEERRELLHMPDRNGNVKLKKHSSSEKKKVERKVD